MQKILYILNKIERRDASADDVKEVAALIDQYLNPELDQQLEDFYASQDRLPYPDALASLENWQPTLRKILATDQVIKNTPVPSVHRIHFLKTAWFRYAAAILILFGIGTAVVVSLTNTSEEQMLANSNTSLKTDVAPGSHKAILTLADGSTIILDSASNGALAQQGNAQIVKLANGEVAYNQKGAVKGAVMINTLSTPRGGQYQLTLPDGSKVWLNAASSITYPAMFIGKERNVKITGEVYFEIVGNKAKPFIVDVDGKSSVEVLGTSFNINSYADEVNIKTTLLEGSVKVSNIKSYSVVLKPHQQAVVPFSDQQLKIVKDADVDKALAWKNGTFNFQDMSFPEAARQLERWYDIQVIYEGQVPDIQFKGDMDRGVNLSDILRLFTAWGIKARIEGNKLIIQ